MYSLTPFPYYSLFFPQGLVLGHWWPSRLRNDTNRQGPNREPSLIVRALWSRANGGRIMHFFKHKTAALIRWYYLLNMFTFKPFPYYSLFFPQGLVLGHWWPSRLRNDTNGKGPNREPSLIGRTLCPVPNGGRIVNNSKILKHETTALILRYSLLNIFS